ncbi:hypothetical protein BDV23DRAFT_155472 [Aspergillus alliaceus]|uniref:Uncharacterized protein n=1 Tax=Petromyces alliaceus TaxID=209559 RepID=A0A5N7C826_PETAA|nr:hypothetical protein BDV23DRAFT_155472 [Aspergillus alliaceus]
MDFLEPVKDALLIQSDEARNKRHWHFMHPPAGLVSGVLISACALIYSIPYFSSEKSFANGFSNAGNSANTGGVMAAKVSTNVLCSSWRCPWIFLNDRKRTNSIVLCHFDADLVIPVFTSKLSSVPYNP